jgi:protein-export membrane protein SecD
MSRHFRWLVLIVLLTGFAVWAALPDSQGIHIDANNDGEPDLNVNVRQSLGLDLVGGLRVLLQAELPSGSFTRSDLEQAANNVARRVNALGVGEATVQVVGADRILVELPGASDCRQAIDTIQQTALLEFVDFSGLRGQAEQYVGRKILTTQQVFAQQAAEGAAAIHTATPVAEVTSEATPEISNQVETAPSTASESSTSNPCLPESSTEVAENPLPNPLTSQPFETVITGAELQAAAAQYAVAGANPQGEWHIQFELRPEAAGRFGSFTGSHIGEPLAIVLDGTLLSAPIINSQLDTGGVITGNFNE